MSPLRRGARSRGADEARRKSNSSREATAAATASPARPSSQDRLAQAFAATQPLDHGGGAVAEFIERFSVEQKAKRKKLNNATNQRTRERELLAAKARASTPSRAQLWLRDPDGYVVVIASPDGEAA
jgi:hypothetical protein